MPQNLDIAIPGRAFWTQRPQRMLGVSTVAGDSLLDLFVDNDEDLDTGLCPPLQNLVQPPLLVEVWRASQEQLRRKPPVHDINRLFGLFQGL